MSRIGIKVTGDKQLERKLRTLGMRVGRKVLRSALSAAATPVVKSAKANVESDSGLLKKSLGKVVKLGRKKLSGTAKVGARNKIEGEHNGEKKVPWRYSHLVELGHVDEHGNHVPAKPFLRPAADENGKKSQDILSDKLAAGIVREAARG